jgi:hypothetical protein
MLPWGSCPEGKSAGLRGTIVCCLPIMKLAIHLRKPFFLLNTQALEMGIVDLNLPFDGFSRASGLPFRYSLSSFWRQKEGKTARLTQLRLKRKALSLHPQNSPCTNVVNTQSSGLLALLPLA